MTPLLITSHEQLDSLVAEKVAGWEWHGRWPDGAYRFIKNPDEEFMNSGPCKNDVPLAADYARMVPPFSRSADAVLTLLEKAGYHAQNAELGTREPITEVNFWPSPDSESVYAHAPTFPLAACLALLRSKGLQVELGEGFGKADSGHS